MKDLNYQLMKLCRDNRDEGASKRDTESIDNGRSRPRKHDLKQSLEPRKLQN